MENILNMLICVLILHNLLRFCRYSEATVQQFIWMKVAVLFRSPPQSLRFQAEEEPVSLRRSQALCTLLCSLQCLFKEEQ